MERNLHSIGRRDVDHWSYAGQRRWRRQDRTCFANLRYISVIVIIWVLFVWPTDVVSLFEERQNQMNAGDLKLFYNDLRAAAEAGIAMEIGVDTTPEKALTVADIDRFEKEISSATIVSPRLEAAIKTWRNSNSMIPVFEGLSTRINAWNRIGRLFRKSLLYILALAALAIAGLIHFRINVFPNVERIRQDLITIANSIPGSETGNSLLVQIAIAVFSLMLVALVLWLIFGGSARTGWWIGGDRYIRCRTLATAARVMQLLVFKGMETESAAQVAGSLVGLDRYGMGELMFTVKEFERDAVLSPSWADYLLMIADRQYVTTRTWGPLALSLTVGGIIALLYVMLAWLPIVSLFYDLSRHAHS